MVRDHPLLGVGLDNFAYLYQQVYLREGAAAEPNLSHPHNWLLHVWLELGVLGLIAFVWLLVRFWQAAPRGAGQTGRRWLVAGALGSHGRPAGARLDRQQLLPGRPGVSVLAVPGAGRPATRTSC